MKFYYIFWFILACSLSITAINTIGVFDTDYATMPEGATYEISDINGSLNNTMPQDDVSLAVTGFFSLLGFLKDLAVNTFYIYGALITIFQVPPALAVILQAIVAISWAMFIMQVISRWTIGGSGE